MSAFSIVELLTRALETAASMSFSETMPLSTSAPRREGLVCRVARCWL